MGAGISSNLQAQPLPWLAISVSTALMTCLSRGRRQAKRQRECANHAVPTAVLEMALARGGWANPNQAMWVGAKLRTNYGPRRPNSAHLNGQPWTPAGRHSRSTTVKPRSGGQGVASSNLASPTKHWRIVTPDQSRVHPATGASSTSLSLPVTLGEHSSGGRCQPQAGPGARTDW